jgi:alkylation response protein AidB-like acyl-CoA dehydrogenase
MGLLTGVVERVPAAYYTDERQAILESARAFAMNEVLPIANRLDPVQGEIPMELRQKMAELGYFGLLIPQEYGGLGLGIFEYVLITEELARAWMSVASIIARGNGNSCPLPSDFRWTGVRWIRRRIPGRPPPGPPARRGRRAPRAKTGGAASVR